MASGSTLLDYQSWSQPQQEEQQIQIEIHKDKYNNNNNIDINIDMVLPPPIDLGFSKDLPNGCSFRATEFGHKATKKNSTHQLRDELEDHRMKPHFHSWKPSCHFQILLASMKQNYGSCSIF